MSAAVVSTSVIGSAATTTTAHRLRSLLHGAQQPLLEDARVREEERRVEAVEHEPGHERRVRVARRGRGSPCAGHAAEHRVVRMPRAPQEGQDREPDRDPDPDRTPNATTPRKRDDREREVDAVDAREPAQRRQIDEADHRRDHDGGERRVGRFSISPSPTTSTIASATAATTPVSWVFAPAASATGVRDELLESGKPWKAGGQVGRAERAELLVLVDALVAARGVAARQHARVGEREEREREGGERQLAQVAGGDVGTREARQALGSGPPLRSRPPARSTATSSVAPATAMNTPGTFGAMRRMTRITARQPAPIASATGSVWSSAPGSSRTASTKLSADSGMPSSFGSCVKHRQRDARQVPRRTGFEIGR